MAFSKFPEQVKKHFQYLVDDYGFSIVTKHAPEIFGGSAVNYESDTIGVEIALDRGEVFGRIGPRCDPPETWNDIASLILFLFPQIPEPPYEYPERWNDPDAMIEWQVARLARITREHLAPVLKGEFSQWKQVTEYWRERGRALYKEQTGLDIPR